MSGARAAGRLLGIALAGAVCRPAAAGNDAGPADCCERIPLDVSIGKTPVATLVVGEKHGAFLIDFGATGSAIDANGYGVAAGTRVELVSALCGPAPFAFRVEDMASYRAPAGGQRGRIGTDCLGRLTVVFAYGDPPSMTARAEAPDPASLTAHDLVEVGWPARKGVRPSASNGVPLVALAIGPVTVPAQLDTGFDDSEEPGIVQGNAALLAAFEAHGVAMHPVPAAQTLGCAGVKTYRRWRLDADLAVVASDGTRAGTYPPPLVEIKDDAGCGGIAAMPKPYAQIGASWLARWRTTVIDGPGGKVWIAR